jgi:glycerophosphoryl diester phosphodiesterase
MATFPSEWWRGHPLIFAHRGASQVAPENTLAAFRRAVEIGADGIELDVQLSADGVPVVIHDAAVDRTTDGSGWVRDLTLTQLQELNASGHAGAAFAGERIPTLEEVLAEVGDKLLIDIELKYPTLETVSLEAQVIEVIQRLGMQRRVWLSSFKPYALHITRRLAPEMACGLIYGPLSLGSWLLAPITPHEALHPHASLITERMMQRAHKRGLRVITWTVDDPAQAQQLATRSVDAIITNTPGTLLDVNSG